MRTQEILFEGSKAIEIITDNMRLVVVTAFGPRIAFFGKPDGDNLLLWEPGKYTREKWDLAGGHRVWATRPGADENEDTYALDNGPCEFEITDNLVHIIGAENTSNRTRRGLSIKVLDDDCVSIDNFLINTGDMLYSCGIWALTCTIPSKGSQYAIPIGDGSSWDAFNMVFFREWAGHGQGGFNDDQFIVAEDMIIINPKGMENKRMIQAHHGIIAMQDPIRKLTFIKKTDYYPSGKYPMNTNIAVYIGPDNFMVEMETMGPEETIKPGKSLHHAETWLLKSEAIAFSSANAIIDILLDRKYVE